MMNEEQHGGGEHDAWSAREELILACAVRSHGVTRWQDVAVEVRTALSHIKYINPADPHFFTPQKCRLKFKHLLLQFDQHRDLNFMIEELRQRHIQELQSEIQLHDHSIQLMKQHIKKLQGAEEGPSGIAEAPASPAASDYIREKMTEFLGILRMYENSSLFEHRLPPQDTEEYAKTIRQHMDFQMVESRIVNRDHDYQHSYDKFFRDLLLIFTNATTFFPKRYTEHKTARILQEVVCRVLRTRIRNHVPGGHICFADALPRDERIVFGLPNSLLQPEVKKKTTKKKRKIRRKKRNL